MAYLPNNDPSRALLLGDDPQMLGSQDSLLAAPGVPLDTPCIWARDGQSSTPLRMETRPEDASEIASEIGWTSQPNAVCHFGMYYYYYYTIWRFPTIGVPQKSSKVACNQWKHNY